jgi:hypothetical protein
VEQGVAFVGDSRCRDQQNEKAQSGNFRAIAIEVAELRALRGAALNGRWHIVLADRRTIELKWGANARRGRRKPAGWDGPHQLSRGRWTRLWTRECILKRACSSAGILGFLGSHVCERVLDAHDTRCSAWSNFFTRTCPRTIPSSPDIEYARKVLG